MLTKIFCSIPYLFRNVDPDCITSLILEGWTRKGVRWERKHANNLCQFCQPFYTIVRINKNTCPSLMEWPPLTPSRKEDIVSSIEREKRAMRDRRKMSFLNSGLLHEPSGKWSGCFRYFETEKLTHRIRNFIIKFMLVKLILKRILRHKIRQTKANVSKMSVNT